MSDQDKMLKNSESAESAKADISSLAKPVMICLIGEQPVPNILPIRACKTKEVCLVYTERTEPISENLAKLLTQKRRLQVPAYNVVKIYEELAAFIERQNWATQDLLFNVTGGTKPMSLAAFQLARQLGARVVYLESESGKSRLDFYEFIQSGEMRHIAEASANDLLAIDDYLNIHGLGDYNQQISRNDFEVAVAETLRREGFEVLSNVRFTKLPVLELDLVIRLDNQFGVAELKTGDAATSKGSIDQLNSATARENLGIYTKRFLIIDREYGVRGNNEELARAYNINVISLTDSLQEGQLSLSDQKKLVEEVRIKLSR